MKEFALENFVNHFCNHFEMFYGSLDLLIDESKINDSNKMLLRTYIENYVNLNQEEGGMLNIVRFFFKKVIYAPIDKSHFMALNYLQQIITSIEPKILDYLFFYRGYFIFSSLSHHQFSILYDYFYPKKSLKKYHL